MHPRLPWHMAWVYMLGSTAVHHVACIDLRKLASCGLSPRYGYALQRGGHTLLERTSCNLSTPTRMLSASL